VGGSWSTRREPTHAQGEHANSTQKFPQPGVEPGILSPPNHNKCNCIREYKKICLTAAHLKEMV